MSYVTAITVSTQGTTVTNLTRRAIARTLAHPVRGTAGEQPLLAVWVLVLAAMLVPLLPLVPVFGYLVRVLDASAREQPAPPLYRDIHSLLVTGFKALLVLLAYLAVPLAVLLVSVYGALSMSTDPSSGLVSTVTFYGGSTAVFCISLVGTYLCPVGLWNLGASSSLRAAFDTASLRRVGGHAAYFASWSVGVVLLVVVLVVAAALGSIPRLGPIVGSLVVAYGSILTVHLWGRSIGEMRL